MIIRIARTETKQSKGGAFLRVEDTSGRVYSCFDLALFEKLRPGNEVEATTRTNDKGFVNIVDVLSVSLLTAPPEVPRLPFEEPANAEASKQARIANSVALKAVVDVRCRALEIAGGLAAAHIAQGKKFGSTEVCAVADELVAWVLGGVEGSTEMLANLIQAIDNGKEPL